MTISKKIISCEESKTIQLEILKSIHDFCNSNNISYSLTFGTMLGAVRHKGFIPWDDDIDIMMLRDDYNRLLSSYSHKHFLIADNDKTSNYHLQYAKIYDSRTIVKEYINFDTQFGVGIDIFPVDNIPDSSIKRIWMFNVKKIFNFIHILKVVRIDGARSATKNFVLHIGQAFLRQLSITKINNLMSKWVQRYNNIVSEKVGIIVPDDNNAGMVWPRSFFEDIHEVPFEDTKALCVAHEHEILTSLYGDYMQLPPVEERVTHHAYVAYWNE